MKMDTTVTKERCTEITEEAVAHATAQIHEDYQEVRNLANARYDDVVRLKEEVEAQKQANAFAMQTIDRLRANLDANNRETVDLRERVKMGELRITQLLGIVANQAQALAKGKG